MTDRDPRAASPAASPARIPVPEGGLGSHELETESDDPAVLRQSLLRAKERLAFYEGFDRIIGENIRRSGELMLETIALREEAQAAEHARLTREAQIEKERQAERAQTKALLAALHNEIAGFQQATASLAARVADALRALEPDDDTSPSPEDTAPIPAPDIETAPPPAPVPPAATPESDARPAETTASRPTVSFRPIRHASAPTIAPANEKQAGEASPTGNAHPAEAVSAPQHRTIDLVVNGIARATTALAFQRALSGQDGILNVETREFAEGVLRLKVDVADDQALADGVFASWPGPNRVQLLTRQADLIALELTES